MGHEAAKAFLETGDTTTSELLRQHKVRRKEGERPKNHKGRTCKMYYIPDLLAIKKTRRKDGKYPRAKTTRAQVNKSKKSKAARKIEAANKQLIEGLHLQQKVDAFVDMLKANDPTIHSVTVHVHRVEEYSR